MRVFSMAGLLDFRLRAAYASRQRLMTGPSPARR